MQEAWWCRSHSWPKYSSEVEHQVWNLCPPGECVDAGGLSEDSQVFLRELLYPWRAALLRVLDKTCFISFAFWRFICTWKFQMLIFNIRFFSLSFHPFFKAYMLFIPWAKNIFNSINRRNSVRKCRFLNPKDKLNLLTLIISQIVMERWKGNVQQSVSFFK